MQELPHIIYGEIKMILGNWSCIFSQNFHHHFTLMLRKLNVTDPCPNKTQYYCKTTDTIIWQWRIKISHGHVTFQNEPETLLTSFSPSIMWPLAYPRWAINFHPKTTKMQHKTNSWEKGNWLYKCVWFRDTL